MSPDKGLITALRVVRVPGARHRGRLLAPGLDLACAIGRTGVTRRKREGDGGSPAGRLAILGGYYRPDRFPVRPRSALALRPLRPDDGWCDEPRHPAYNSRVRLPFPASHEEMWRPDGLYDVVLVLDWNVRRRARNRGSAIFLHLARPDFAGTAGCVALRRADLVRLLARLAPGAVIEIG